MMDRSPSLVVCKATSLLSLLRTGRAAEAEAAWPSLLAAAPLLQTYRSAPRLAGSPCSRRGLDRSRAGPGVSAL